MYVKGLRAWRWAIAPLVVLVMVPAWPVAPEGLASGVTVRSASAAGTAAIERAANVVHGCGFSLAKQYLWPVEISSNGWALGRVDARNPTEQGNGDLLLHLSGGKWHYVTCGSLFATSGPKVNYPVPVVMQLENAMPSISAQPASPAMAKTLESATTNWSWCPGSSQLWPIEVTGVGWAGAMLNGAASGYCVVIYTHGQQGWRVFAYGTTPKVWSSENVPDSVLLVLQSALKRSVATLKPPLVTEPFHTVLACDQKTALGQEGCGEHQVLAADKQLNADVAVIFGLLGLRGRQDFIAAQKSWLSYRSADCQSQSDVYQGGTEQSVAFVYCLAADDSLRREVLKSFLLTLAQGLGQKAPKFP